MIIWYGIGLDILALTVGLVLCTLGYRWARQDGYTAGLQEGRSDHAHARLTEQAAARRAPRHARTQPRHDGTQQPPWETRLLTPAPAAPEPASQPRTAALPRHGAIAHALQAAGVRPRTGPFNTTGEMAAITDDYTGAQTADTDDYIQRMEAEEAAYRQELTASAPGRKQS
jgi:hypothetical protein